MAELAGTLLAEPLFLTPVDRALFKRQILSVTSMWTFTVVCIPVRRVKQRPIFPSTRGAKRTIKQRGAPTTAQRVIIVQERPVVLCRVLLARLVLLGLRVAITRQQRVQRVPMHLELPHVKLASLASTKIIRPATT